MILDESDPLFQEAGKNFIRIYNKLRAGNIIFLKNNNSSSKEKKKKNTPYTKIFVSFKPKISYQELNAA